MSVDLVAAQSPELMSLLEQLPEGVFLLDSEAKVIFANKPGLRLLKLKAKQVLHQEFPFPIEDGTMRDVDVDMLVKHLAWSGSEIRMVYLRPLKSAGAFHLEWKLESALERARAAEALLEEHKAHLEALSTDGTSLPRSEGGLQGLSEGLAVSGTREQELQGRLDDALEQAENRKRTYDERVLELELLLEQAEARVEELEAEPSVEDHQASTELQQAMMAAREAEDQRSLLEVELAGIRDRMRVAEEQAEVAEERAYGLESELERLEEELHNRGGLDEELKQAYQDLERERGELSSLKVKLNQSESELTALLERWNTREKEFLAVGESEAQHLADEARHRAELAELYNRNEQAEEELARLKQELDERTKELDEVRADATEARDAVTDQDAVLAKSQEELAQKTDEVLALQADVARLESDATVQAGKTQESCEEIVGLTARLEELTAQLEALGEVKLEVDRRQIEQEHEVESLRQQLAEAEETLRVRSEESDELAEQLRVENEQSEELLEQIRQENEGLLERLASIEASVEEADFLRKEVQKLSARLEEMSGLADKAEHSSKLERKLEGALARAEEAEELLSQERRSFQDLHQASQLKIAELEDRPDVLGGDGLDPETERLAFQDPLTGLPNRHILHRYLGFMLKQASRYDRTTALLRIDCDHFKSISDTMGIEVSDRLLRLLGERLSAVVRASDVLGRWGGDEFAILLPELQDQQEASVVTATVINRIHQVLKAPFIVGDHQLSLTVSIGVSLFPLDSSGIEEMFEHAYLALKRAKATGLSQVQYFTPEVQASHEARQMIDQELRAGLQRQEFSLLYQPIFDLSNGQVVGMEALVRWHHPRLGVIEPDEFLKVAEESGMIVLIGNWAVRTALAQTAAWQQAGLGIFVSVNLSRRQLLQADLVPMIYSALSESRCSSERILFEISEELTGPELPRLRSVLAELSQLGVRLAVDNFGTSASSLEELRRGPFQVLKIDRRFINGVPTLEDHTGIVLSALTLGHHLGRVTIAVGVETEAEKTWLAKTGCRFAQGNLMARPLTPDQVTELLARR